MAFRHDTQTARVIYGDATKIDERHIDFDLPDYKGRRIGYSWSLYSVPVSPAEGSGYCYMQTPELAAAGKLYRLYTTVTRNGSRFGGGGAGYDYFLTVEDAIKAMQKKAAAARKRYAAQPVERR